MLKLYSFGAIAWCLLSGTAFATPLADADMICRAHLVDMGQRQYAYEPGWHRCPYVRDYATLEGSGGTNTTLTNAQASIAEIMAAPDLSDLDKVSYIGTILETINAYPDATN